MAVLSDLLTRKKDDNEDDRLLLEELRRLNTALGYAYEQFEMLSDSDLVEATIFEIEAIKARYRYLLGVAKSKNLKA